MQNHKLILVFNSFDDEDHARWYGQYLKTTHADHIKEVYVVVEDA